MNIRISKERVAAPNECVGGLSSPPLEKDRQTEEGRGKNHEAHGEKERGAEKCKQQ